MRGLSIIFLSAFLSGCIFEKDSNEILVDGQSAIEVQPDSFRIEAEISVYAETKNEALSMLADRLATLTDQLPQMEGLSHLEVTPVDTHIMPVYEEACMERRSYRQVTACPIEAYLADHELHIKARPAQAAGNLMSFASELGANSVAFGNYFISDLTEAQRRADEEAFLSAFESARRLADAANVKIAGVRAISQGKAQPRKMPNMLDVEELVVVSRASFAASPRVEIPIEPPMISVTSNVTVAFKIENPAP